MHWLLQLGDTNDDDPKILTLDDSPSDGSDASRGITALPGGALEITVRSAAEARDTLVQLQRVRQELLTARARAAGEGVVLLGASVSRQIRRPNRHLRRTGVSAGRAVRGIRRIRPSAPVKCVREASSGVFDGLDAAILVAETAGGIDDALKIVGSAIEAVGSVVSEIDLGGIDFD